MRKGASHFLLAPYFTTEPVTGYSCLLSIHSLTRTLYPLQSRCPLPGGVVSQDVTSIVWSPVRSNDVSWNFEKFLVDHEGFPVKRYLPSTEPFDLVDDIESLIKAC